MRMGGFRALAFTTLHCCALAMSATDTGTAGGAPSHSAQPTYRDECREDDELSCTEQPVSGSAMLQFASTMTKAAEFSAASTQTLQNAESQVKANLSYVKSETASPAKARILHHHIWKNGGTHFCEMARTEGFTTPPGDGCHRPSNLSSADGQHWSSCAVSPEEFETDLRELPYNFIGHECAVSRQIMALGREAGFVWVTILRDPVEQVVSHYRHVANTSIKVPLPAWVDEGLIFYENEGLIYFDHFVPNMQTYFLTGKICVEYNISCVEEALQNLRRMSVVLMQQGRATLGMSKLEELGWTEWHRDDESMLLSDNTTEMVKSLAADLRAKLEVAQSNDIALLQRARDENLLPTLDSL